MRFTSHVLAAIIVVVALTRADCLAQQGWTHPGDINHTNVSESVPGDIHVEGKIDGGSIVYLTSTAGSITIDGKIDGGSSVSLNAAGDIRIGVVGGDGDKKIDGNSKVMATSAGGQITLGNKIDGGTPSNVWSGPQAFTVVTFIAKTGIDIGNKIDGGSKVYLGTAPGARWLVPIHIHDKIANSNTEVYYCGKLTVDGGIHDGAKLIIQKQLCGSLSSTPSPVPPFSGPPHRR